MALYVNGNKIGGGGGNSNMQELTQEEYDELTTEEKNNGTVYYITDVNGDGESFQPIIYSENEREIGVWVDGKPLYEITIDQTVNSDSDYVIFSSGIDHAYLVNSKFEYATNRWMSSDYSSNSNVSNSIFCYAEVNNGALNFHNQSNHSRHWIATIRYTKTTDAAGSGTWTPQGVPAVHYSTDEQVVGTWIDGSTLYEKTIVLSTPISMNANSWGTISTLTEQINIVSAEGIYNTGTEYAFYPIGANCDTNKELTILNYRNVQNSINIIILRYTKTTS